VVSQVLSRCQELLELAQEQELQVLSQTHSPEWEVWAVWEAWVE
jgi:hypothetical protein